MASTHSFNPNDWQVQSPNFRWIYRAILALVVAWALLSCFSTVPADSVGVLIRFGKFQEIVRPGLRFKLPLGIDHLELLAVERQLKVEFGFKTSGASDLSQGSREPEAEQSMVTGDLNMALVEWVVQYRIEDPRQFLFQVRDPKETVRDASESVMREIVGDRTVDEVLTIGRQEIEVESLLRMKELAKFYGLGVSITQVQLKDVHPPRGVQASFNEVNQAQQEREQMINVANGEYNKAVPRTRGEADQRLRGAEGYALSRVNEAKGDAERFTALLNEYLKAPEVTRQRLYLETMATVLPALERKVILDEKVGQLLPLLQLDAKPAK
ncbi:MAG TPA: FtsH protease activity modulator HflK [Chthoniobacteraceae bacterium]|jgi:membrane protease subunit HflK